MKYGCHSMNNTIIFLDDDDDVMVDLPSYQPVAGAKGSMRIEPDSM